MNQKFILIDLANVFFRSKHVVRGDLDTKVGMALHITLSSVNKIYKKFGADHVVFCLEGKSWRKEIYPKYKKNRADARAALTEKEQEEEEVFWEAFEELTKYLKEKTNCSVIRDEEAEGDDIIARWIALHPNDNHTIISNDSDFVQLLADNVQQYNGVNDHLITTTGITDGFDRIVTDNKTGKPKELPDPEWLLFEKCIRGDSSDNIFSAYPGVRKKGTKNKTGLIEAYADRHSKGFAWNNLMLQRWTDHNGEEHRVLDDYERNRKLIDLSAQPQEIKDKIDEEIRLQVSAKAIPQIGIWFMKFCGKQELTQLLTMSNQICSWLKKQYQGELVND